MNLRMWAAALALALSAAVMDAAGWVNLGAATPLTAFAVDPSRPGTLYAATGGPPGVSPDSPDYTGTIFKTTDRGTHWNEVLTGPMAVNALVVDPTDPRHVWALKGVGRWIYQTTDAGEHWAATGLLADEPREFAGSLAVSADGTVLYAGGSFWDANLHSSFCEITSYAIAYRSLDGGTTWRREPVGLRHTLTSPYTFPPPARCPDLPRSPAVETLVFDHFDSNVVYAIAGGTLFHRSAAQGWASDTLPDCIVTAVAASPLYPGHIRIGSRQGTTGLQCSLLLDSSDAGQTFVPAPSPFSAGTRARIDALAPDPTDPNVWYVAATALSSPAGPTGHLVFATTDSGHSWRNLDWPRTLSVRALVLDGARRTLYAVSSTGVFAREVQFARSVPRAIPFRP